MWKYGTKGQHNNVDVIYIWEFGLSQWKDEL